MRYACFSSPARLHVQGPSGGEGYGRRLKRCCEEVNRDHDVQALCKSFGKRLRLLEQKQGGRLPY